MSYEINPFTRKLDKTGGGGGITSVNGQTGPTVTITASNIGALTTADIVQFITSSQASAITSTQIAALTSAQIPALPTSKITGIESLVALSSSDFTTLRIRNIGLMPTIPTNTSDFAGLNGGIIGVYTP